MTAPAPAGAPGLDDAKRAEMRKVAEAVVKRGNGYEYCDGHGNVPFGEQRRSCEWCGGDQYGYTQEAVDVLALLDAVDALSARAQAETERAERAERQGLSWEEQCVNLMAALDAARAQVRELAEALEPFVAILDGALAGPEDLHRAARALAAVEVDPDG